MSGDIPESSSTPAEARRDQMMQDLIDSVQALVRGMASAPTLPSPVVVPVIASEASKFASPGDSLLKNFRSLHPPTFGAKVGPTQADDWVRDIENIFESFRCSEEDKRRLATYQLVETAGRWWETKRRELGAQVVDPMTWDGFKTLFLEKFYSEVEKRKREEEFSAFIQGNLSVADYRTRFDDLSRYAPHIVDTERKKAIKFVQGLNPDIRELVWGHEKGTFSDLMEQAERIEEERAAKKKGSQDIVTRSSSSGVQGQYQRPWHGQSQYRGPTRGGHEAGPSRGHVSYGSRPGGGNQSGRGPQQQQFRQQLQQRPQQ